MTANLFGLLNTGRASLAAQLQALEVSGQNIANAQTKGYSRQTISFEANAPQRTNRIEAGLVGRGVSVSGVERIHDEFLFNQIIAEGDTTGEFQVRKDVYDQMEILLSDGDGRSLNNELSDFFSGFQDIATNPNGLAERSNMVVKAQEMTSVFNALGNDLFQIQRNQDQTIGTEVDEINSITSRITKLNQLIHGTETDGVNANELRDERDRQIRDLSEKIDIHVTSELDGEVDVLTRSGIPLVIRETSFELSTQLNGNNKAYKDILISNGAGATTNITTQIQGGRLKGLLDMRDVETADAIDRLDRLSASLVREVNRVHQQGFGLDKTTGNDFFSKLTPTVKTNVNNTGTATVVASNNAPATTSIDKFELTFTSTNTFTVQNLTANTSEGTFSFTSGQPFNLLGGLGMTVSGTPAVGDKFKFSLSENAASTMSVASAVRSDPRKVAAGTTSGGDGVNAQNLANLQTQLLFDGVSLSSASSGTFTFDEFYTSLVSDVGIRSFAASSTVDQQEGVLLQLDNRRESISGVSIDEEMVNIIKFQQSFNASSRLISTVQELLDRLINQT
ncbi:MAG: flagellar hook-associated protein FlgK [Nitrospinae bacterium CG11_big_fil_rev_8_21_14_0_20_45_15]|nr:MAG: flagellar hook-associated protein FlgK [Nitrospinae bacterium CG11_big_fil_rev_8_21_14_0_20_45_15]